MKSTGDLVFLVSYFVPPNRDARESGRGPTFIKSRIGGVIGLLAPAPPARIVPDWIHWYCRWSFETIMDAVREVARRARDPENLIIAGSLKTWALTTSVRYFGLVLVGVVL